MVGRLCWVVWFKRDDMLRIHQMSKEFNIKLAYESKQVAAHTWKPMETSVQEACMRTLSTPVASCVAAVEDADELLMHLTNLMETYTVYSDQVG
jgi:hypothetical protein